MHRFMLDYKFDPQPPEGEGIWFVRHPGTVCEGVWFTGGAVAVYDFDAGCIRTFESMAKLQEAYADLELRWLDNADEYWDAEDMAVRSSLKDWTPEGPDLSITMSPVIDNLN